MSLENPIYISNNLSEAEAPPRDSFIDSFNANNLICSGSGNVIRNSRRSTIIGGTNSAVVNKYNTHKIGDVKSAIYNGIDTTTTNNVLRISCANGIKIKNQLNKNSLTVQKSRDIICVSDVIANNASDIKLKDNIFILSNVSEKVNKLRVVSFVWNNRQSSHSGRDIGLIAQEVEKQFPEITATRDNGVKAVDYKKMTAVLVACVKEKQKRIDNIKKKIKLLNNGAK